MSRLTIFLIMFFFFNDTPPTEIYTLSLHDALPICNPAGSGGSSAAPARARPERSPRAAPADIAFGRGSAWRPFRTDRKSTRLNSSHSQISYAVFCLKKKNKKLRGADT